MEELLRGHATIEWPLHQAQNGGTLCSRVVFEWSLHQTQNGGSLCSLESEPVEEFSRYVSVCFCNLLTCNACFMYRASGREKLSIQVIILALCF